MSGFKWRWAFTKEWNKQPKQKTINPYRQQDLTKVEKEQTKEEPKTKVFCCDCRYCRYHFTSMIQKVYCSHPVYCTISCTPEKGYINFLSINETNTNNDCIFHENKWHKRLWKWFVG